MLDRRNDKMSMSHPPVYRQPGEGRTIGVVGDVYRFLATGVARTGMFASMPIGSQHSFKNEMQSPARMLITVAPAGLEKMFFEVGQPVVPGANSAPPPTPEIIEKLLAIAPKYGIEIKLPPT
jgi:hypothetical protein